MSISKNINDNINEVLQSYSSRKSLNSDDNNSYSFIEELTTEMPTEMFTRHSTESITGSKNRSEKSFVIWELITSEIVYLKQIYFIINTPFPILNEIKQQFFPKIDVYSIFGNLMEVFRSNVIFWSEYMEYLYQILKISTDSPDINHLISGFNNFSKHFVPYKSYCMNISSSIEYITKFELENDNFRQFLEWCRNSDSSNRLGLDTFITMPFQRITRYSLFLERILKECTEESEIQHLTLAINEVDKFVNNINKCVKIKELTAKLRSFQNIVIGFPSTEEYVKGKFPIPPYPVFNLLCSMLVKSEYENEVRCLIHQDTLRLKQVNKKTMSVKVLLFTDLLIFAKPIKKNQQCRLQLIDHPIMLDQIVIYDSHTLTENEHCFFLAEINHFSCYSNVYKLSNDKSSNCRNSVKLFLKKINIAKAHYEAIMVHQIKTNVHINVINTDEISFQKETFTSSSVKDDDGYCQENSASHQSGSSSISDNESENEYPEFSNKSLSSSSWTDLENNLNSCIISDPFIHYFDLTEANDGTSHRNSYRYLLQNYTDKFGRRKHDSIQSFSVEGSSTKIDSSLNMFRRSSLGNKHGILSNIDNE